VLFGLDRQCHIDKAALTMDMVFPLAEATSFLSNAEPIQLPFLRSSDSSLD
jgi:hypothetical protein